MSTKNTQVSKPRKKNAHIHDKKKQKTKKKKKKKTTTTRGIK